VVDGRTDCRLYKEQDSYGKNCESYHGWGSVTIRMHVCYKEPGLI
jgi:hypothetical protein